jgi:hypothetical protein
MVRDSRPFGASWPHSHPAGRTRWAPVARTAGPPGANRRDDGHVERLIQRHQVSWDAVKEAPTKSSANGGAALGFDGLVAPRNVGAGELANGRGLPVGPGQAASCRREEVRALSSSGWLSRVSVGWQAGLARPPPRSTLTWDCPERLSAVSDIVAVKNGSIIEDDPDRITQPGRWASAGARVSGRPRTIWSDEI